MCRYVRMYVRTYTYHRAMTSFSDARHLHHLCSRLLQGGRGLGPIPHARQLHMRAVLAEMAVIHRKIYFLGLGKEIRRGLAFSLQIDTNSNHIFIYVYIYICYQTLWSIVYTCTSISQIDSICCVQMFFLRLVKAKATDCSIPASNKEIYRVQEPSECMP